MIDYRNPCGIPVPLPALVRGWLHGRQQEGPWDAERLTERMGDGLWLSFQNPNGKDSPGLFGDIAGTVAGFGPAGGFLELSRCPNPELEDQAHYRLCVYAASAALAARILEDTRDEFLVRRSSAFTGPRIAFLNASFDSLQVHRVRIGDEQIVPRREADLFYGEGTSRWIDEWIARLQERRYGLSILSGESGTGKTTLLRSLASWMRSTHLFYFMPAARFTSVDAGEVVGFWARENRVSTLRKILVIEDAESVVGRRAQDNRERVATLLNLTDGILGDALGVQVICTLNSDVDDLDPALLRPGRLMTHREFGRLPRLAALRLAVHLGRPAPIASSSSLAEIFNSGELDRASGVSSTRLVGFHAGTSA